MNFGAGANLNYIQKQGGRRLIALVCLFLVCFFAGFAAAHQHALDDTAGISASKTLVCELCATAFQTAVVIALLLSLLHPVAQPTPDQPELIALLSVEQAPLFSRPPPVLA